MKKVKPVALVTGGSRGIGAAICRKMAEEGYHVIVNYLNSKDKAESLAKRITGTAYQADVGDSLAVQKMFAVIQRDFGALDVLVNSAGIATLDDIQSVTEEGVMNQLRINVWGTLNCIHHAQTLMSRGSIVVLSSICATRPTPDALGYAASKAGVEALVTSLAKALAPAIRINAVAPGATYTDMMLTNYGGKEEAEKWVKASYPLKRIGQPEDIAEMVAFLCSDKAQQITGQTFVVDGGRSVA